MLFTGKWVGLGIVVLSKTDHISRQMYIFSNVRTPDLNKKDIDIKGGYLGKRSG